MHPILWLLYIPTVWYNSKLYLHPRISCYHFGWLSALQFVLLALEVLTVIKATFFYNAFCPLFCRLELSHNVI